MKDLSQIEMLVLDVDGVLTDGRLYVGSDGAEWKAFSILDGAGLKLLQAAGIHAAVISGHASEAVGHRFKKLGLTEVHVGIQEKGTVFDAILDRLHMNRAQAAVMGDDVMDLALFREAGFRATVPDAHADVLRAADYVTTRRGGRGAVREVIDLILKARGAYDRVLERFGK